MKDVKVAIEQHFLANWHSTPIQWEGVPFNAPDRWISISLIPIDRKTYAFDGQNGRKRDTIQMKIACFDTSPTLVLGLEDEVRTFIECYKDASIDMSVGDGVPNGNGVVNLDNGVFQSISLYDITRYN